MSASVAKSPSPLKSAFPHTSPAAPITFANSRPKFVSPTWSGPHVDVNEYTDPLPTVHPISPAAVAELLVV
jgi:hypothetical protein